MSNDPSSESREEDTETSLLTKKVQDLVRLHFPFGTGKLPIASFIIDSPKFICVGFKNVAMLKMFLMDVVCSILVVVSDPSSIDVQSNFPSVREK